MKSEQIKEYLKNGQLTTPSYVLDMDDLTAHVNAMKNIMKDGAGLCYAMKANPFIVPVMAELVDKIEVCSPGELSICQAYGIPGDKIIFSGVNKTHEDVEAALDYGVAIITVESNKHFRLICEYCEKHHSTADVLFRVTNGSQFGMDTEAVESILAQREKYDYIHVKGIHYFSGTQKKRFEKLQEELDELDSFMNHIQETYGLSDLTLEYGAGLPVPYFEGEDFDSLYQPLEMMMAAINEKKCNFPIVLELGRFFAFSCGTYLTRVEEVKNNKGSYYILVDGGIHQLNYYGQNMAMRLPKMELFAMGDEETDAEANMIVCNICGSLCTLADVLARKWNTKLPKEDDVIAFYNAGSYSITEAPALFLSRKMPVIYTYSKQSGLQVLRDGQEAYRLNLSSSIKDN